MSNKFEIYFSHSWHPSAVNLNIYVWKLVAERCNLLIDIPDTNDSHPPYFVNRLEELLRRSDLFLSILSYREPDAKTAPVAVAREDSNLRCSPWLLFEIRLAERANLPRLIIYDVRTGFRPPRNQSPRARYVPHHNFSEIYELLSKDEELPLLKKEINNWLDWAERRLHPIEYQYIDDSLIFLPASVPARNEVIKYIEEGLDKANYQKPMELKESFSSDAELFRLLASGGLLVAEVGDKQNLAVYCAAHALFIPSVRLLYQSSPSNDPANLPWLLQGHPGGYQNDIVTWTQPAELGEAVGIHAKAMQAAAKNITNYEEGKGLFEKRRYIPHSVFISHNMPLNQRELVDCIVRKLKNVSITCWEYGSSNRAAQNWKARMREELEKTTHFIALLSNEYEQSAACVEEIEWALAHTDVKIIAFLAGGRIKPNVKISELHHQPLTGDLDVNATTVALRVKELLLA